MARPFTGLVLDRATTERKDDAAVQELLRRPDARGVAAGPEGLLLTARDGTPGAVARIALPDQAEPILLGLEPPHGRPLFALDLDAPGAPQPGDGTVTAGLRDAVAQLSQSEGGLASYATALLNWHRRHRFCANCGAPTRITEAGYSRHCARCGADHFPRTDPVVIMTVEHQGHLLLGHRAGWPDRRYSVLAGFIDPGESAEEAVIREIAEESGIVVRDPVYVSSQPWPFPASLMLGFEARSDGGDPRPLDGELDDVAWFSAAEIRAARRDENPRLQLPSAVSIARFLIEHWLDRVTACR